MASDHRMTAPIPIVILSYARTPMGASRARSPARRATDLGAAAVEAAVERAGVAGEDDREDLHGLRAPRRPRPGAGAPGGAQGRACPRQVEATTVNKMCGSGMQAAIMAADALAAGSADIIVAGGMESMTNAPYLLHQASRRRPHRPRHGHRPYVPRRARGRLRAGPADGQLRRGHARATISSPARRRTITRSSSLSRAKAAHRQRRLRARDRRRSRSPAARARRSSTTTSSPRKGDASTRSRR